MSEVLRSEMYIQLTFLLEFSPLDQIERLEHSSLLKDGLRVWRHGAGGSTTNVSMMTSGSNKKHRTRMTLEENLHTQK